MSTPRPERNIRDGIEKTARQLGDSIRQMGGTPPSPDQLRARVVQAQLKHERPK